MRRCRRICRSSLLIRRRNRLPKWVATGPLDHLYKVDCSQSCQIEFGKVAILINQEIRRRLLMKDANTQGGFTLIELVFLLAVAATLAAIFLPAVQH